MKNKFQLLTVLVAVFFLMSFLGCSKKKDESQEGRAVETDSSSQISTEMAQEETETSINLGDVLSSWVSGDRKQAARQFVMVNWDHPEVFASVPVLNISQQDFMTSTQDKQMQFMQDTKSFATNLRKLGLHVLSVGDTSVASGDKAASREYYESVLQCAQSIASNDYYELIQLTAKGLIKAAEDKLLQLEGGQQNSRIFDIKEIDLGDQSWGLNLLTVKIINRTDREQPFWLHIGGRYQHTGRARGFGMGMKQPIFLKPHEERLVEHRYWIPPQLSELAYAIKFVCPTGDLPPQDQDAFLKKTYTVIYTTPNSQCNELTPLPQFFRWAKEYSDGTKIPPFKVVSTERFVFYLLPETPAEKDIQTIAKEREKTLNIIRDFLNISFDQRVNFFLFPDAPSKSWCMGHQGDGLAFDTTIAEIYNEETRVDPAHELTHIVASQIGSPPALMNEGLAVYMQSNHKWNNQHIDTTASELLLKDKLVPLDELIKRNEIGSRPDDGEIAYPQSASFVKFIIDKYGPEQFLKLYARLRVGAENNANHFKDVLGVELKIAEREWKKSLSTIAHEKG
ncbi:MAG: hypothetical protein JRF64_05390 [Deltaproteobacteria bacterium]|nr:hypothetical protein [Deltaproteobacteria bacterium]